MQVAGPKVCFELLYYGSRNCPLQWRSSGKMEYGWNYQLIHCNHTTVKEADTSFRSDEKKWKRRLGLVTIVLKRDRTIWEQKTMIKWLELTLPDHHSRYLPRSWWNHHESYAGPIYGQFNRLPQGDWSIVTSQCICLWINFDNGLDLFSCVFCKLKAELDCCDRERKKKRSTKTGCARTSCHTKRQPKWTPAQKVCNYTDDPGGHVSMDWKVRMEALYRSKELKWCSRRYRRAAEHIQRLVNDACHEKKEWETV